MAVSLFHRLISFRVSVQTLRIEQPSVQANSLSKDFLLKLYIVRVSSGGNATAFMY